MAALSAPAGSEQPLVSKDSRVLTREEHALREMGLKRDLSRVPRRSRTVLDYQVSDVPGAFDAASVAYALRARREQEQLMDRIPSPVAEGPSAEATTQPESNGYFPAPNPAGKSTRNQMSRGPDALARRPPLPPPRRSYSVTDHEPAPRTHRPSDKMALTDLPGELHYAIFDFLDPIDGTCLGLTNKHFYAIHRRMHGSVPLSVRREGPNDMEWAWHLAGTVRSGPSSPTAETVPAVSADEKQALTALRVRGQAYCRKCGITRCELHKHIQSWMGESYEYCSVRQKFGPKAPEGTKSHCHLYNPKKPGRCGRHRVAKTYVPPATLSSGI